MNYRNNIVSAIYDRLNAIPLVFNSLPVTIYKNRYSPLQNMPAVSIYATGDGAEKSIDEQAYKRTERIKILIYISGEEENDAGTDAGGFYDLDSIISQIEENLFTPRETLGGIVYRFNYVSTDIQINRIGENLVLIGGMSFDAIYFDQIDN